MASSSSDFELALYFVRHFDGELVARMAASEALLQQATEGDAPEDAPNWWTSAEDRAKWYEVKSMKRD